MPTEYKLLAGVLALCVSYDIGRHSLKKKLNRTVGVAAEMLTGQMLLNQELHSELEYMCHVLNRNEITLDRLDFEALPHIQVMQTIEK